MLFNSYEYIFMFLPISFFLYFIFIKRDIRVSKTILVVASLGFYSWWSIIYLPLIVGSILFNYYLAIYITTKRRLKKTLLIVGVSSNLLLLGYFKYVDFFIENVNFVFNLSVDSLNLALPLAISFFTFQQIAYLVDSYRDETGNYSFLDYTVFVSFFPQLIAGPIVHHKEMMPQFEDRSNKSINYNNIALGLFIFSIGIFKKVVIADGFAIYANKGFLLSENLNLVEAWITSLSYTFQLYFDFSGYADMAIGSALLFNIKLPINFNSPYKATSIQDFWRRWHMTLSRFLRDYIYIPLGGNRVGNYRVYFNLFITFLIGGLWHGAGWTFILWGTLHGLALIVHRLWEKTGIVLNSILAWFITFNFVNIAWVFFRASNFDEAMNIINAMFFADFILPNFVYSIFGFLDSFGVKFGAWLIHLDGNETTPFFIVIGLFIVLFMKNSMECLNSFKLDIKRVIFGAILLSISILGLNEVTQFLYFNF